MFDSSRTAREIHNIYQKVLGLRHAGPTEFDAARAVQE
jgi:hypothetical protein